MTSFALLRGRVRRAVLGRRRLLAAGFAAIAVAAALRTVTGPPSPTTQVLTAARDLPSGRVLRPGDLRSAEFAPESVPSGVLGAGQLIGRTTASPLRSGEPVTDVRLVRGSLLDGYPGLVAAPVRIGDAEAVRLLRVGDRIDLLAADPQGAAAEVIATDVPIIALPGAQRSSDFPSSDGTGGALIVVAMTAETALRVAESGVSSFISMVIRH
jgi:Flp pilus assembly protein CpaB